MRRQENKQFLGVYPGLRYSEIRELNRLQYEAWRRGGRWEYSFTGEYNRRGDKLFEREWMLPAGGYMKYEYEWNSGRLYLKRTMPMKMAPSRLIPWDRLASDM